MRRKEFISQLLRISELNSQLSPLRDVPLFCCRQTKLEERPQRRETGNAHQSINPETALDDAIAINKKEVFVLVNHSQIDRVGSAKRKREGSAVRFKTSPSNPTEGRLMAIGALNHTPQPLKAGLVVGNAVALKVGQFLNVKEIPRSPYAVQEKEERGNGMNRKLVQAKAKQWTQKSNPSKKQSLTQPNELENNYRSNCDTLRVQTSEAMQRKIEVGTNPSTRSDSFKKYQSTRNGRQQQKEAQRRNKISIRKQINRNYTKPYVPPPKITARSYIIYEIKSSPSESKLVVSFNSKNSQQVASLTKIMTCVVTLQLCGELEVDRSSEEVEVGRMEASVGGTTALLVPGQVYTIEQLLYGLMLPSGNDASVALAVWGGRRLLEREGWGDLNRQKQRERRKQDQGKMQSIGDCNNYMESVRAMKNECYNRFVQEMNAKAKWLNMAKTTYANSHGLINSYNKSSAFDIAILCDYAMRNKVFRDIVHSRSYRGMIRVKDKKHFRTKQAEVSSDGEPYDSQRSDSKDKIPHKKYSFSPNKQHKLTSAPNYTQRTVPVQWQNTHKLMQLRPKQYIGIKTGFTTAAGPCLSSCVSVQGRQFIIVVLGCGRMSLRFKQTQILKRWLYKHLKLKRNRRMSGSEQEDGQGRLEAEEGVEESKCSDIIDQLNADKQIED